MGNHGGARIEKADRLGIIIVMPGRSFFDAGRAAGDALFVF